MIQMKKGACLLAVLSEPFDQIKKIWLGSTQRSFVDTYKINVLILIWPVAALPHQTTMQPERNQIVLSWPFHFCYGPGCNYYCPYRSVSGAAQPLFFNYPQNFFERRDAKRDLLNAVLKHRVEFFITSKPLLKIG